jgi:hypothetical protein
MTKNRESEALKGPDERIPMAVFHPALPLAASLFPMIIHSRTPALIPERFPFALILPPADPAALASLL